MTFSAPTLARTLRSTNPVESMIEICREHTKNVKRWPGGQMALRRCAAGMLEADHQFRCVDGHLHLPKLRAALEAHFNGMLPALAATTTSRRKNPAPLALRRVQPPAH